MFAVHSSIVFACRLILRFRSYFRLVWVGHQFKAPRRHTLSSQSAQSVPDRRADRTFTFKPGLHVTFFSPFKNELNEYLRCCSHMTLKYVKKDQGFPWQKWCEKRWCKRSLSIVNKNSIPLGCTLLAFDRFCARNDNSDRSVCPGWGVSTQKGCLPVGGGLP